MDALQHYGSDSESEKEEASTETDSSTSTLTVKKAVLKSDSQNYFGIVDSSDDEPCDDSETSVDQPKTSSMIVDGENVCVEIPGSKFWSDIDSEGLQNLQRQTQTQSNSTAKRPHSSSYSQKPFLKRKKQNDAGCISFRAQTVLNTDKCVSHTHSTSVTFQKELPIAHDNQKRKLFFIHPKISKYLQRKKDRYRIPTKSDTTLTGHGGAVNRVKWNIPSFSHLLVSCSMDTTVKIWNIWTQLDSCLKVMTSHSKAVRDVEWSHCGRTLLTCSYDKSAQITDVETGKVTNSFPHTGFVTCGKFYPSNPSVCLTGGQSEIQAWDKRTPDIPCKTYSYKDNIGLVQDLVFKREGMEFFTSSDMVSRDSADRSLMAWDYATGVTLSNQIYQERYTLSRLKLHPSESCLLAQSSGNYIALFSTNKPYKMNKSKRFDGHKLLGYSIGFDISPDGSHIVSGSSDGNLYCYNYQTGRLFRKVTTDMSVVMDTACHPVLSSTLACCGWDGNIRIWY